LETTKQIAFTICACNYLAHAKTLGDSYLINHPDHTFIIGLVDRITEKIDLEAFNNFTILPVANLAIENFESLNTKYNITELSTSVKPSYFHYIFKNYNANKVLYIDPDILVTSNFIEIFDELEAKNIVITPHMCSPIDDEFAPTDYHVLGGGVYNLGFIGLSNYPFVKDFLSWWHDRVIKYGYRDNCRGMFYDQLWINYVPCFFDKYKIIKHLGYNMANWNFHERILSKDENGQYLVNGNEPLRFFHFSSYKYNYKDEISWYQNRYNFTNREDLKVIFYEYHDLLVKNKVERFNRMNLYYYPKSNDKEPISIYSLKKSVVFKIYMRLKKAIRVLISGN
jgi:hypothetical protein